MQNFNRLSLFTLAASAALAVPAAGQNYDFVNVATTSGPYLDFGAPAINAGAMAFFAQRDAGGFGIFTGPDPVAHAVATTDGRYSAFVATPTINATGTVAFFAVRKSGGSGIFTGPDPVADAVATTDAPYSEFVSFPTINAAGTVAFLAFRKFGGSGVFTGPDPVSDAVVTSDGPPYSQFDGFPAINDAGVVAFHAIRDAGGSGIFTGPDAVADAVATNDGPYSHFDFNPAINAAGAVAFRAFPDAGGEGIFTGPDPVVDAVATSDGSYSSLTNPAINDAGVVAFHALHDTGGEGIFTGPDAVADKVVASGDRLLGSAVSNVRFHGQDGLNDFGDVGFSYTLSNGVQGVAVAITSHRYTAAAGGSFDDAKNYAFGAVPRDVVPTVITPANGIVITGPAAPKVLRSLTLGTFGNGVAEVRLTQAGQLTVSETLDVQSRGKLRLDGAVVSASAVVNAGEIELRDDAQLNGVSMLNFGTLRGDGTVGFASLENAGRIEAIGTGAAPVELAFTDAVLNAPSTGLIVARNGALRFNGGLDNQGALAVSFGTSDVFGNVNNTGAIQVSGGAQATFYDDLTQNGTMQVAAVGNVRSTAVLFGAFTGAGGFIGGGDVFALGDLRPGNSPDVVTYDGNLFLGSSTQTFIELAGLLPGEFDQMIVTGDLSLAGSLDVSLIDGFALGLNQSFLIADIGGMLEGQFVGLPEGGRVGTFDGVDLFVTYAVNNGGGVALYSIPEPTGLALLALTAFARLARRRRKPAPLGEARFSGRAHDPHTTSSPIRLP